MNGERRVTREERRPPLHSPLVSRPSSLAPRPSSLLLTHQAEVPPLNPAQGAAGADQDVWAARAHPPNGLAGAQAREHLGLARGRQPQGGVLLHDKADAGARVDAEVGGHAEQEHHDAQGGHGLVPGRFGAAQDAGQQHHGYRQP